MMNAGKHNIIECDLNIHQHKTPIVLFSYLFDQIHSVFILSYRSFLKMKRTFELPLSLGNIIILSFLKLIYVVK